MSREDSLLEGLNEDGRPLLMLTRSPGNVVRGHSSGSAPAWLRWFGASQE
jgi:hypothetical protein